jgi:hypothetical protein
VIFYDGTNPLSTVALSNGTAVYSTSSLSDGAHSISASYPGTEYFLPSTSNNLQETVTDFVMTFSVGSLVLAPGKTRTLTFTVSPAGGTFTFPVVFSATGLPPGATATFDPPGVASGSRSVTTTLTIYVPLATTTNEHSSPIGTRTFVALGLLFPFVGLLHLRRARKGALRYFLLAFVSLGVAMGVSSCVGSGFFAQPPQTYTVTVSATSNSVVHSASFQLTVE